MGHLKFRFFPTLSRPRYFHGRCSDPIPFHQMTLWIQSALAIVSAIKHPHPTIPTPTRSPRLKFRRNFFKIFAPAPRPGYSFFTFSKYKTLCNTFWGIRKPNLHFSIPILKGSHGEGFFGHFLYFCSPHPMFWELLPQTGLLLPTRYGVIFAAFIGSPIPHGRGVTWYTDHGLACRANHNPNQSIIIL